MIMSAPASGAGEGKLRRAIPLSAHERAVSSQAVVAVKEPCTLQALAVLKALGPTAPPSPLVASVAGCELPTSAPITV